MVYVVKWILSEHLYEMLNTLMVDHDLRGSYIARCQFGKEQKLFCAQVGIEIDSEEISISARCECFSELSGKHWKSHCFFRPVSSYS